MNTPTVINMKSSKGNKVPVGIWPLTATVPVELKSKSTSCVG